MKQKQFITTLLILCGLLFSLNSYSQFKLGIKAGYNSSNLAGLKDMANVKDVMSLSGYHAGFFGQIKIPIVSLQIDALYSTQGAKFTDSNNAEHKYENSYVNFPLVGKIKLGPIGILAGIQYGILTSSKIDGVTDDTKFTESDLSIPVGLAFDLSRIMIEARYNIGAENVSNTTGDLKNDVIQISAGFRFKN